nr:MAG TPA: hypothetical protein [Caudoviricetes sp.]
MLCAGACRALTRGETLQVSRPFPFPCPIRAQLFHRRELADQVAAVFVGREVVQRAILETGALFEQFAVTRLILRAVCAQHERQLALLAVYPVAIGLAAGVAVGGIALDGDDVLSAHALADARMIGLDLRIGKVVDQHVTRLIAGRDPLAVGLGVVHQLAAARGLPAAVKEMLVRLLKAPPYKLHTPVHAVHAVGFAVLLAVARLLHRADLLARDGEDVFCSRHALRPLVDGVLIFLRLSPEIECDDRAVDQHKLLARDLVNDKAVDHRAGCGDRHNALHAAQVCKSLFQQIVIHSVVSSFLKILMPATTTSSVVHALNQRSVGTSGGGTPSAVMVSEATVYHVRLKIAMDMYLSRFFILPQCSRAAVHAFLTTEPPTRRSRT